eukprot:14190399-Alexandrium_andersonii.AAC.1
MRILPWLARVRAVASVELCRNSKALQNQLTSRPSCEGLKPKPSGSQARLATPAQAPQPSARLAG